MLNKKYSPWPSFPTEEADAVHGDLLINKVNCSAGTECREFEQEFVKWCCPMFAVSLCNGTLVLDGALKALGVNWCDEAVVRHVKVATSFWAGVAAVAARRRPHVGRNSLI